MDNIYFFDTETTSADDDAKIIQFAGKYLGTSESINLLFDPQKPIEIGAMAVHHITEEMVKGKGIFSDVAPRLQDIFDTNIMVAHNAPFDIAKCKFEGVEEPKRWIDTLKVAKHILQDIENPPEQYNMQYLRYWFGIKIDADIQAHDALGDVLVLEQVFLRLKEKLLYESPFSTEEEVLQEMITLSTKPLLLKLCPFKKHKNKLWKDVPKDYIQWLNENIKDKDADLQATLDFWIGQ